MAQEKLFNAHQARLKKLANGDRNPTWNRNTIISSGFLHSNPQEEEEKLSPRTPRGQEDTKDQTCLAEMIATYITPDMDFFTNDVGDKYTIIEQQNDRRTIRADKSVFQRAFGSFKIGKWCPSYSWKVRADPCRNKGGYLAVGLTSKWKKWDKDRQWRPSSLIFGDFGDISTSFVEDVKKEIFFVFDDDDIVMFSEKSCLSVLDYRRQIATKSIEKTPRLQHGDVIRLEWVFRGESASVSLWLNEEQIVRVGGLRAKGSYRFCVTGLAKNDQLTIIG